MARFALNLVPDEDSKTERFQEALYPWTRNRVACLEIKEFTITRLVNIVAIAERGPWDYEIARE